MQEKGSKKTFKAVIIYLSKILHAVKKQKQQQQQQIKTKQNKSVSLKLGLRARRAMTSKDGPRNSSHGAPASGCNELVISNLPSFLIFQTK